jgi:glycerate kinase
MPLRVLIAPDKFKGTLSARKAAQAIARGWQRARPDDTCELLPISDGGDGFGAVMSTALDAQPQRIKTVDAAHRPRHATWWWGANTKTAIIESAQVIGLALLPPGQFHPFELDTFGLGAVLLAAQRHGAKHIIVGIGGSATNDGGFGVARALGWEFFDRAGKLIEQWTELHKLASVRRPRPHRLGKVIVAVDVQNVLLGVGGATRVYGPQKGLKPSEFAEVERNLRRLARVVTRAGFGVPPSDGTDRLKLELQTIPGAGAAGGLGFGLLAFGSARLQAGFALFARHAQLAKQLRRADLVITGEGAIDASSAMGKGTGQLAQRCRRLGIPCVGLAGKVVGSRELKSLFDQNHRLTDVTTEAQAKTRAAFWLARLAARAGAAWRPAKTCAGALRPATVSA